MLFFLFQEALTTHSAYDLARIYYKKGDIQDTKDYFKLVLESDPNFGEVREYQKKV